VGAGSAGCVLANRLSEDPESSVLIIEAGGSEDENFDITVPIASANTQLSNEDWKFRTVPQKKACLAMREKVLYDRRHVSDAQLFFFPTSSIYLYV
jgi:choline dehydrogenase-like flavoprotein